MTHWRQIYEEAEGKRNLFILPRREQYMWPLAKYTKKPRGMETNLSDFYTSSTFRILEMDVTVSPDTKYLKS